MANVRLNLKKSAEIWLVYLGCAFFLAYFQFQTRYLIEADSYYHVAFGQRILSQGFVLHFPWVSEGLWTTHFTDKEIIFHYILALFGCVFGPVLGAKIATVALGSCVLTQFYRILRRLEAWQPWIWLLLLLSSGGFFLYRINVARPQVLAVFLTLLVVEALLFREYKKLFVLSWVFPYSYTAAQLPVILAFIASSAGFVTEGKWDWKLCTASLKGVACGLIINPYFPHNLIFLYYQNFLVLGLNDSSEVASTMAGELGTLNFRQAIFVSTTLFTSWGLGLLAAASGRVRANYPRFLLLLVSGAFLFLAFYSKRFMEYATPFGILYGAAVLSPLLEAADKSLQSRITARRLTDLAFLVLMVLFHVRSYRDVKPQFQAGESQARGAALKLAELTSDKEKVFVCDWDDAPELWFFNPKASYTVFLDPVFFYSFNPERWRLWYQISNGEKSREETVRSVREDFAARVGVCSQDFSKFKEHIQKTPGARLEFENPSYFVFSLPN